MAGGRCGNGGILGLLDLIEGHRAALRYDWRTRFDRGLDESVPDDIGWSEAIDLVRVLRMDPASQLAASIEGWSHPLDRQGWMLADLIDLQGSSKAGKKWKAYPRPLKPAQESSRKGNAAGRTPEQVKAILASQFGPRPELN